MATKIAARDDQTWSQDKDFPPALLWLHRRRAPAMHTRDWTDKIGRIPKPRGKRSRTIILVSGKWLFLPYLGQNTFSYTLVMCRGTQKPSGIFLKQVNSREAFWTRFGKNQNIKNPCIIQIQDHPKIPWIQRFSSFQHGGGIFFANFEKGMFFN